MTALPSTPRYGEGDATFQAVGGEQGVGALVDEFYRIMATNPAYATIRGWHPDDLTESRDKLARFLCGWMGGPRRYSEKYGPMSIPGVHAHLDVGEAERDQWLDCMADAIAARDLPRDLADYLLRQLAVPAERVRVTSGRHIATVR